MAMQHSPFLLPYHTPLSSTPLFHLPLPQGWDPLNPNGHAILCPALTLPFYSRSPYLPNPGAGTPSTSIMSMQPSSLPSPYPLSFPLPQGWDPLNPNDGFDADKGREINSKTVGAFLAPYRTNDMFKASDKVMSPLVHQNHMVLPRGRHDVITHHTIEEFSILTPTSTHQLHTHTRTQTHTHTQTDASAICTKTSDLTVYTCTNACPPLLQAVTRHTIEEFSNLGKFLPLVWNDPSVVAARNNLFNPLTMAKMLNGRR